MQAIPPQLLVCRYLMDKSFIEPVTPGCFGTIKAIYKQPRQDAHITYEVFDQKRGTKERKDGAFLYDFFRYLHAKKLQIVNVIGEK